MGDRRVEGGREVFDDVGAENRLPKPSRSIDPLQLWARGELRRQPALKHGPVEDPIARADQSFFEGVVVTFI
jgi:hypothetical protein